MKPLLLRGLATLLFILPLTSIAQTTYKDVAPIFIANCNACHHNGGITFSMTKYSEVVPMAASIKSDLNNGIMPPWPADPTYKHYIHERVVSAADKATLISWIDNGTPAGDTTLAPQAPAYGAAQLKGTPDLIINLPTITSTATTNDMYYCVNVPAGVSQDRYIRAFEFLPGNAAIIHHAVITIDTTGTAVDDLSGSCYNFQGQVNIGDYAPGMGPTVLPGVSPVKFGLRLKAGSKFSFQIHMPEGTSGLQDQSQLRLYFYPIGEPGIREMYFQTVLQNWTFTVPANDSATFTAKYPTGSAGTPIDISLYSSFPHSHKTCTAITNYAYKGADTIPLIRIPHWDFHWQGQYTFTKMVHFPQTYHLMAVHKFDNTTNNPNTPNPNVAVPAGYFTTNEMLFDSYLYTYYQTGDENVDIASILASDTLFYPTGLQNLPALQHIQLYPNPAQASFNLAYTLPHAQWVQVRLYDVSGNLLQTLYSGVEDGGVHEHLFVARDLEGRELPAGSYLLSIQAGHDTQTLHLQKE